MKIISWNVNGIRSIFKTTFRDWLATEDPDIVCLQEIKADDAALAKEFAELDGYYAYFHPAVKRGYSGVAVYSKVKPDAVERKLGIERFDDEGRCLKLAFKDFILFNFYIPNGGRMKEDIGYKLDVYKKLFPILKDLSGKETILAGDFNVAHTEQDLCYPKQNQNNTMFTLEERKQIDTLLGLGYIDAFRKIHPEEKAYTWWSYAYGSRQNDIGWRIDYIFVSRPLASSVTGAFMRKEVLGSDHGPFGAVLKKDFKAGERPVYEKSEPQNSLF